MVERLLCGLRDAGHVADENAVRTGKVIVSFPEETVIHETSIHRSVVKSTCWILTIGIPRNIIMNEENSTIFRIPCKRSATSVIDIKAPVQIVAELILQSKILYLQNCFFLLELLRVIRCKHTLINRVALSFIVLFPFFIIAVN